MMRRTWVVYIEQGIGHELNNTISDTEWYGPYTSEQADRIVEELNKILHDPNDSEHPVASSMPLNVLSPRDLIRKVRREVIDQRSYKDLADSGGIVGAP